MRSLVQEIRLLGLDSISIVVILCPHGCGASSNVFQLSDDPLIPTYYIAMATREYNS